MDPMALRMLRSLVTQHQAGAVRSLRDELTSLQWAVERALSALDHGQALDEHLLHNRVQLTATIGKYNLLRDLAPLVNEENSQ